jgi:selenocysteine lyase/cysteine desulfurase/biotin carboxylase
VNQPLLLLGGASLPAGADCLAQARARGVEIWLLDTDENLSRTPELVDQAARVIARPYFATAECVNWAVEQAKTQRFLGVYGFRELVVETVAAVAAALGLPGNPVEAVRRVRDKHACRQELARHGFPQPPSALCDTAAQARAFMTANPPGPWIVKPPAARGSAGVSLVRHDVELGSALAHLDAAREALSAELAGQGLAAQASGADTSRFLVERFQRGEEYSAEGVFVDGVPQLLAVTAKVTTGAPHFVEIGHTMPAGLGGELEETVRRTLQKALPALGLGWGVFHVEFWLDGDEVVLGEVHVRPGGDHIHVMTQHITDVELHGVVFDQMLGRSPDPAGWRPKRAAAMRFLTPPPGTVTSVDGWERVRTDPRLRAGKLTLSPGDRIAPLRSSFDRSSFVLASGPTAADAVAAAEQLAASVTVRVAAEPGQRLASVRDALPAVVRGGYFNAGYTGPLSRAAHAAIVATGDREYEIGRMGPQARAIRQEILRDARRRAADLMNARIEDVALTHHSTDGINAVVHGLPWQPGDNAVTTRIEHKGGVLPLGVLRQRRGVELRAVEWDVTEPMDVLTQRLVGAIDGHTRLVALSHVSYVNGGVLDIEPVVAAAHRHGALVLVDGAQAAGCLPIDVVALSVDAYVISGQKWLCGPEGTGALYVRPEALDRIAQTFVGWASVTTWDVGGGFRPNPDVSRFEIGTRAIPQVAGFAAAMRWLSEEVGWSWAYERTHALAELAREELRERAGVRVLTPDRHVGLVSFRPSIPPDELVRRLDARGINIRSIFGYDCARASIGFFHTEDEVRELVDHIVDASRPG